MGHFWKLSAFLECIVQFLKAWDTFGSTHIYGRCSLFWKAINTFGSSCILEGIGHSWKNSYLWKLTTLLEAPAFWKVLDTFESCQGIGYFWKILDTFKICWYFWKVQKIFGRHGTLLEAIRNFFEGMGHLWKFLHFWKEWDTFGSSGIFRSYWTLLEALIFMEGAHTFGRYSTLLEAHAFWKVLDTFGSSRYFWKVQEIFGRYWILLKVACIFGKYRTFLEGMGLLLKFQAFLEGVYTFGNSCIFGRNETLLHAPIFLEGIGHFWKLSAVLEGIGHFWKIWDTFKCCLHFWKVWDIFGRHGTLL